MRFKDDQCAPLIGPWLITFRHGRSELNENGENDDTCKVKVKPWHCRGIERVKRK